MTDEAQELQKEFRDDVRATLRKLSDKIDSIDEKLDESVKVYATIETLDGIDDRVAKIEGYGKMIAGAAFICQLIGGVIVWFITTISSNGK